MNDARWHFALDPSVSPNAMIIDKIWRPGLRVGLDTHLEMLSALITITCINYRGENADAKHEKWEAAANRSRGNLRKRLRQMFGVSLFSNRYHWRWCKSKWQLRARTPLLVIDVFYSSVLNEAWGKSPLDCRGSKRTIIRESNGFT